LNTFPDIDSSVLEEMNDPFENDIQEFISNQDIEKIDLKKCTEILV
jgi:hypothetical protein